MRRQPKTLQPLLVMVRRPLPKLLPQNREIESTTAEASATAEASVTGRLVHLGPLLLALLGLLVLAEPLLANTGLLLRRRAGAAS